MTGNHHVLIEISKYIGALLIIIAFIGFAWNMSARITRGEDDIEANGKAIVRHYTELKNAITDLSQRKQQGFEKMESSIADRRLYCSTERKERDRCVAELKRDMLKIEAKGESMENSIAESKLKIGSLDFDFHVMKETLVKIQAGIEANRKDVLGAFQKLPAEIARELKKLG